MRVRDFHPASDVPNLSEKIILVTGGTAGIGKQLLLLLAAHNPAHLFFTGRNVNAAEELTAQLRSASPATKVTFLKCDLGSLSTVSAAAKAFLAQEPCLDVYVANAGIMAVPPATSPDGHEVQFAPLVGHVALLDLLLPALRASTDARVLMATSQGYALHPTGGIQFDTLRTPAAGLNTWTRYGQAKLGAVLYARELARRESALTAVSVHPGVARTGLVTELGWASQALVYATCFWKFIEPDEAAYNLLWLAAVAKKEDLDNGGYYEPVGERKTASREGENDELAGKLWIWLEEELKRLKGEDS